MTRIGQMIFDDGVVRGREEGREEGRRQVELIKLLLEKKQYDDAKRVTEDEEYCEQLCEEYNI